MHHYHHQPPHQVHYQRGHGHGRGHRHMPHFPHPHFSPPHSPHHHHQPPLPPPLPQHHPESHYHYHEGRRRSPFIRFLKASAFAIVVLILWAFLMDSFQLSVHTSAREDRQRSKARISTPGEKSTPEYHHCPCESQPVEVEVPIPEDPGRVLPIRYPPVLSQPSLSSSTTLEDPTLNH
ncbi:hypothetical protein CPB84DRAFT_1762517 [Gymnopilus junonius]|uniref:Uncharacterized protein n=1 Tax=Gymnopilus junonius TaxID=109634 RepID=A0A9P5P0U6_GYMJU|nr:hypothetical protein CPB84DRAFT_1762517 [Gymnopilus junonius]